MKCRVYKSLYMKIVQGGHLFTPRMHLDAKRTEIEIANKLRFAQLELHVVFIIIQGPIVAAIRTLLSQLFASRLFF